MSAKRLNLKPTFNRKLFLLVYLLCFISLNSVNGLKQNRGPLEEVNQSVSSSENDSNLNEMDDEFTGSTYLEPANDNKSFLEKSEDYEDEDYDYDEEEDIDLDSFSDASLLEMKNISDEEGGKNEGKGGRTWNKINPKLMNGTVLKNYLNKISAADTAKKAKLKTKKAISGVKSKFSDLHKGYKNMKGKRLLNRTNGEESNKPSRFSRITSGLRRR
ncbi:uncharacterized protein TA20930 [Theileria annulata]|uniref:Uncharacterized protein n=1 Tax=Theileria annulata TaxID=5874 RepID=Q4UGW9_THEAN|nr:uncharacterized protein TA20930 [Theileria annulata]CAI73670.1 hypothetical protein TA20930 [Theileria annulata]|eukprot:XP_954347.1 hypothetical protein TA20930 [Theileria annulata]